MKTKQTEFRRAAWVIWCYMTIGALIALAMTSIIYVMAGDVGYLVRAVRVIAFLALVCGVCTWVVDIIVGKVFKDEA